MRVFPYKKINAFTAGGSLGNPAAYIYLGSETLDTEQMLAIAKEHAGFVSEMVFVQRMCDSGVGLKLTYYSSECEVAFCGHGTIAALYDLVRNTPELLSMPVFEFDTNLKGPLSVYNTIAEDDSLYVAAPAPIYLGCSLPGEAVATALGTKTSALFCSLPLDCIDAGLRTLLVPIANLSCEVSLAPDQTVLERFCVDQGFDIVLAFSMESSRRGHIAHTRVFAPKFGYLEDPATGSGNSAFAAYMLKYRLWDGSSCAVEQGAGLSKYNRVCLKQQNGQILFGGRASVKIAGSYFLE